MGIEAYQEAISAEKKTAIVNAARALFGDAGYETVSVASIAERAGVSTATLYKHFRTKERLFVAILARLADELAQTLYEAKDREGDIVETLTRFGQVYADALLKPGTVELLRLLLSIAPRQPEVARAFYDRSKGPILQSLEWYLRRSDSAGTLAIVDFPLAVRQFLAMIDGSIIWAKLLCQEDVVCQERAQEIVASAVATFLARYAANNVHK